MRLDSLMLLSNLFKVVGVVKDIVKDPVAIKLLGIVEKSCQGIEEGFDISLDELKRLAVYAYINKVLNLLVFYGPRKFRNTTLYKRLLRQRAKFLDHLREVVEILERHHIDFVVFKTIRPVPETPVDIDIIVRDIDVAYEAINYLRRRFRVEVWDVDRYSIGIRIVDLKEFVDFYVKPHVANFVYLDPEPLLRHRTYVHISELGREFSVPTPIIEYEFCSILAHMLIKERIITLNDILSLLTYYSLTDRDKLFNTLYNQKLDPAFDVFTRVLKTTSFPTKPCMKSILPVLSRRTWKQDTLTSIPVSLYSIIHRSRRVIDYSRRITYVRGLAR